MLLDLGIAADVILVEVGVDCQIELLPRQEGNQLRGRIVAACIDKESIDEIRGYPVEGSCRPTPGSV